MPWLTPDAPIPTTTRCVRIRIPDSVAWLALLHGALLDLTERYNWQEFGTLTPDEVADQWFSVYQDMQQPGDFCMIGSIIPYATATRPNHTLDCDGSAHLRVDYPDLYAALDTAFIVDADHFITPNLTARFPLGADPTGTPIYNVGDIGGETEHVLTVGELASHSHTDSGHSHSEGTASATAIAIGPGAPAPSAVPSVGVTGSGSASITATGGDSAHNNMPPYIALRYAIIAE